MQIFKLKYLLIILILILGFLLRYNNYSIWPRHGATFDEFAWPWLGINLIQKGVPISWSRHPQYPEKQLLIYQGAAFYLVKPYLEHPPLFGLVSGSFAMLSGASDMYHITLDKIRLLSLFLGTFSILMIFLLVKEIYDSKTALISALLYATIPTVVVGSRILQNENFFIPFWLLSLYFLAKYLKTNKIEFRNIAIIAAALLPLAKVPWFAAPVSLLMVFAYKQKWKDFFITIFCSVIIFSAFIFYGFYFDREIFLGLWRLQLARYDISFAGFAAIFTNPLLVDRYYLDGWIYFGFLTIVLLIADFKKHILIVFPFIAYFLIYLFGIPNELGHGWYRYPFYPFLIISLGIFLKDFFQKNLICTSLFLIFVSLTLFQLTWNQVFGFSYVVYRTIIIVCSLVMIPVFIKSKNLNRFVLFLSYLFLAILIVFNIWAIILYNEQ